MTQNQIISVILNEDVELLRTLTFNSHVWVINTPKVREVCESLWSLEDRNGYSLTHFIVEDTHDEKNNLGKALDSIEVHHSSAYGALDWSEINIYSTYLTDSDITDLLDINTEALVATSDSYKVVRNNGA